jgi:two-component system, chemotaxis family, CheB/CheR fusion protein
MEPLERMVQGTPSTKHRSIPSFPIVGIGASAGGLEAFTELLKHLPATTGMAYVLVQHLDPTHVSLLVDLLARTTSMNVREAREGMEVEADHVYIIAPNTDLTLEQNKLKVVPQTNTSGQHLSIDTFLSSLAENAQHQPIGVILSGTAFDGTLGLQAIKERGGITLAQDTPSAQYAEMPQSAIAAGCVDFIGSPERIAQELTRISLHPSLSQANTTESEAHDQEDTKGEQAFWQVLRLLRRNTNVDFSAYKPTTLRRRVLRRMVLQQINSLPEYLAYLHDHQTEVTALHQDILIGVTAFFRNPEAYQALTQEVFPRLLETKTPLDPLRIWVPGCSTGEEVYSLAICLQEYLTERGLSTPFHLFGTDLNGTAIARARKGIYTPGTVNSLSPERLQRFFLDTHEGHQISASLREHCIFAQHNLLADPPFSHLDLLSCQNVLIYLDPDAQQKIMRLFHYALIPHGFLLLGPSETIGTALDLFAQLGEYRQLYRQKNTSARPPFVGDVRTSTRDESTSSTSSRKGTIMRYEEDSRAFDIQKEMDRLLLARYAPASVVIDAQMEILHFRGQTSPYLQPASGKASFNLFKMARESLGLELRTAISKARKSGQSVKKEGIQLQDQDAVREIMVEVIPLQASDTEYYFMILFEEMPTPSSPPDEPSQTSTQQMEKAGRGMKDRRIQSLENELVTTRQEIHSIVEAMEASNEELQSANEEVLSSNEELRSLNEELETSREEIQSSNEELRSLNEELETSREEIQASNDQLLATNKELQQSNANLRAARAYTEDIVNTLREPLLVLDAALNVHSTNPAFSQFFQVAPAQTEHHLLFELGNHQWDIPDLRMLLEQVLPEKQSFQDFEVDHVFPSIGHKILLLNARRIPGTVSGEPLILLVFEDVTERKELEWHKDAFLTIASHELKTPITSLKAYAQLLRRQYTKAGDEKAAHMLETMEGQANKLTHLIGQLLDTTQLQARTPLMQTRLFDVTALVHGIVEDMQQTTQKHQIHLEGNIQEPFTGDPERIDQVLTNLLSNAIKYSPASEQILVRLREDSNSIILSVQDFGMGIPADKQTYLFERFYRVNDSAHTAIPGLGLGLYISSEIVKQHGGQMWVESRAGEGSTFFARFPRVPQQDVPPQIATKLT